MLLLSADMTKDGSPRKSANYLQNLFMLFRTEVSLPLTASILTIDPLLLLISAALSERTAISATYGLFFRFTQKCTCRWRGKLFRFQDQAISRRILG
jgi:hypothetical protein